MISPFESGKCGMERKKLQKFEYLENKMSYFDEMKNIFYSFEMAIIWYKIKNWQKLADTSIKNMYHFAETKTKILATSSTVL